MIDTDNEKSSYYSNEDNYIPKKTLFVIDKEEQKLIKEMFINSRKESTNSNNGSVYKGSVSRKSSIDMNKSEKIKSDLTIGVFKILLNERLGGGSFGEIFKGVNLKNSESIAVKIESASSPVPQLANEFKVLKNLLDIEDKMTVTTIMNTSSNYYITNIISSSNTLGLPKAHGYAKMGNYNFLFMEELGKSLEDIKNEMPLKKLSLKTVLQIGMQIVRLSLFRDIKN